MTRLFADSINNYTPSGGFSSVLISFSSCCSSYSGPGSESFLASSLMAASFWAASSENRNKGNKSLKKKFSKYFADHAGNVMLVVIQPPSPQIKEDQGQKCLLSVFLAFRLLITFANRLDPDQDRQNVGPYLDPNSLTV